MSSRNLIVNIRHNIHDARREEKFLRPETCRLMKSVEELLKVAEYIEAVEEESTEWIKNYWRKPRRR